LSWLAEGRVSDSYWSCRSVFPYPSMPIDNFVDINAVITAQCRIIYDPDGLSGSLRMGGKSSKNSLVLTRLSDPYIYCSGSAWYGQFGGHTSRCRLGDGVCRRGRANRSGEAKWKHVPILQNRDCLIGLPSLYFVHHRAHAWREFTQPPVPAFDYNFNNAF
jgi:hypothetical protein